MCSVFSTVHYEVDWGLTHIGRQLDMKGMLDVLQQVIPTEAEQGTIEEGNPNSTIIDRSGILPEIPL